MRPRWCALLFGLTLAALPTPPSAQQTDLNALRTAAQNGDTAAQTDIAARYHSGDGVAQNYETAAQWSARAAAAGSAQAQNQLGRYYHEGLGVPRDRAQALRWLEAAAAQGAPEHLFDLAAVLEEAADESDALTRAAALYERAAEAGFQEAAVSLGVLYQNGTGVPKDLARARALYEAPAAAGSARAQNNLGLLYVRGEGVPQDYTRAATLFAAAAEQGLSTAITNLGVMYENGFGVALDEAEAARLYRLGGAGVPELQADFVYDPRLAPPPTNPTAVEATRHAAISGDPVAAFQYGWRLSHPDPADAPDWSTAAALFEGSAEKGHAASMTNLALLYIEGRGRPQDFVRAQMWLILADAAGFDAARPLKAALQDRMTPGQINDAQAMAEAFRAR